MKIKPILPALLTISFPAMLMAQQAPVTRAVSLEKVPATVRQTLMEAAGTGRIESVREVTRDQEVHYYFAELDPPDDRDVVLHVKPDGTISKSITEIRSADVPADILKSFTAVANGNGKVDDVKQILTAGVTTWEAEIDRDGQPDLDVTLDSSGKVLRQQEDTD